MLHKANSTETIYTTDTMARAIDIRQLVSPYGVNGALRRQVMRIFRMVNSGESPSGTNEFSELTST